MSNLTSIYSLGYKTGILTRQLIPSDILSIPTSLITSIPALPHLYYSWWTNLFLQEPLHVMIETALIAFIIYIFTFKRRKDWKKDMREMLTESEKQEVIEEWIANRKPLGRELTTEEDQKISDEHRVVIHEVKGSHIVVTDFAKAVQMKDASKKTASAMPTKTLLNMASHDFLGFASNEEIKEVSRANLRKYGCGACGPRGFYGTHDVHLTLEEEIADFFNAESAILYSDAASAASSTVACFSKRGDVLVVDDGIYEALQTGVTLSRSNVHFFKHNDMNDLRRVLEKIKANDKKLGRNHTDQHRFIVVEGLSKNYGHIAPIDELVALKEEFKYRLIVDESYSFGTIGKHGRGSIDFFDKKLMTHVELTIVSLENSLGSVGGVCLGNIDLIEHQRLSGAGYCYSAASPPFTAAAATKGIHILKSHPELISKLEQNRKALFEGLNTINQCTVSSDTRSSIAFLYLKSGRTKTRDEKLNIMNEIAHMCRTKGVLVVSTGHISKSIRLIPEPSIRLTVTALHSVDDIQFAIKVLKGAAGAVCGTFND